MRAIRFLLVLLLTASVPLLVPAQPAAAGAGPQPERHLGQETRPPLREATRAIDELESRVESLEARIEQLVENLRVRQVSQVRREEREGQWPAPGLWLLGWLFAAGTAVAWRISGRRSRENG